MQKLLLAWMLMLVFALTSAATLSASAQTASTSIETEYLMTLYLPVDPARVVSDDFRIVNVRPEGGWADGPRIKAKVIPPSADWIHVTPGGQVRLDVRLTLQTQDNEIIFMSYGGVVQRSKDIADRIAKGETMKAGDYYFITALTFETKSEKYSWLSGIQAVGKMVSVKRGDHVKYDISVVK